MSSIRVVSHDWEKVPAGMREDILLPLSSHPVELIPPGGSAMVYFKCPLEIVTRRLRVQESSAPFALGSLFADGDNPGDGLEVKLMRPAAYFTRHSAPEVRVSVSVDRYLALSIQNRHDKPLRFQSTIIASRKLVR